MLFPQICPKPVYFFFSFLLTYKFPPVPCADTREYVIARYAEDGQWYRAEVLDYFHDGLVVVLYLDYGNQERLGMADLRTWDDRFDYLPFQAVHCRLANVTRKRGGEGEEEEEVEDIQGTLALREVIYDKRVAVKVL